MLKQVQHDKEEEMFKRVQHDKEEEMLKRVQMTNYRVSRISKRCRAHHDFSEVPPIVIPNLFGDPGLILSEDGGPLTDNVAFSSDQRVFVLKRAAALRRGC